MKRDLIIITFLIAAISLLIKGTVHGMESKDSTRAMESYYRSVEKEYVDSIKECLNHEGFNNAGVMLTKIIDADGNREYTLTINHHRFAKEMSNDEKIQSVLEKVSDIPLDIENISFSIMTTS